MKNTQKYQTKLQEEKKLLEGELADIGKFNKKTNDWEAAPETQTAPEADENDLADRFEDFDERSGTLNVLEVRLNDIKKALKKIEEDRLEANPAANTCKDCLEK